MTRFRQFSTRVCAASNVNCRLMPSPVAPTVSVHVRLHASRRLSPPLSLFPRIVPSFPSFSFCRVGDFSFPVYTLQLHAPGRTHHCFTHPHPSHQTPSIIEVTTQELPAITAITNTVAIVCPCVRSITCRFFLTYETHYHRPGYTFSAVFIFPFPRHYVYSSDTLYTSTTRQHHTQFCG